LQKTQSSRYQDLSLLTKRLAFQITIHGNATERQPVKRFHAARLSTYLKCSSGHFDVLDKDKTTYTVVSKSKSKLGSRFQLHSHLLHVMSRDLVCRSLKISAQLEAFFYVSHSMIYHTEMLMFTVIIDKVKLLFSKPQRHRGREGCGSISPHIVNLGTK